MIREREVHSSPSVAVSSPAFRIGGIHIIESLPAGHLRTGERLFEMLDPLVAAIHPGLSVHFWRSKTRDELFRRLAEVASDIRDRRRAPLLHIETHGGPDGIELASGEHVRWADLKQPLTELNLLCRLNLIVVLAACDGAGLLEVIQPVDRAPAWAVIGPSRQVTAGEIEDAHSVFYRELLTKRDAARAWMAMNATVRRGDSPFRIHRAERMFQEVMRGYFESLCTEQTLAERVERLVTQAAARAGASGSWLRHFRVTATEYISDHRARFEETKKHFFFSDLCPENAARFRVCLDDCLRATLGATPRRHGAAG